MHTAVVGGMNTDLSMVSVVIPAYNEESQIERTLTEVTSYLATIEDRFRWEIIVVDDGSTDNTLSVAESFAEHEANVRVAPHPANFNLGQALRYGFSLCRGEYIITLDADMSYSADHIGRMLDVLSTTEAKIVIASPYVEGGEVTNVPAIRLLASRSANRLLSMMAKGNLTTVTGMVRGYDAVFLKRLDLKAMDVEINAEIIYKAQLMRASIAEIPAHLEWTRDGEDGNVPKFRPSRSIAGFAFVSFLFRPYAYFLVPGAVALVVAIGFWIGALILMFGDGSAIGVALMASMFTTLAAILLGMGVLSAQAKRYFEELFHLGTSVLRAEYEHDRR
jgi:glycosyltransferase involved in cell wall biosynthesis